MIVSKYQVNPLCLSLLLRLLPVHPFRVYDYFCSLVQHITYLHINQLMIINHPILRGNIFGEENICGLRCSGQAWHLLSILPNGLGIYEQDYAHQFSNIKFVKQTRALPGCCLVAWRHARTTSEGSARYC